MSVHWSDALLSFAVQHLWHSASLLGIALLVIARSRLSAEARSWLLLGAFGLAAASPLLVLRAGELPAISVVDVAATGPSAITSTPDTAQGVERNASQGTIISAPAFSWQHTLVLLWLAGTLLALVKLLSAAVQARHLHRSASPAPELAALLGRALPAGTTVAVSEAVSGPMVVGLLRPRILMPASLASRLLPDEVHHLLLHETAHVRRHDLWLAAAQHVVLALYWWSPCLRLLGRQLNLAREMACDARAAAQAGGGNAYARSLLTGADRILQQRREPSALAVGMFGPRSALAHRVKNLIDMERTRFRTATRVAWGITCGLALVTHVGVTVAATPKLGTAPPARSSARSEATATPPASPHAQRLMDAASDDDVAAVRALVAAGAPVDARVHGEGTALIVAARNGHLDMVDALLALGAQPNQAAVGDGNPLIAAARRAQLPVVQRLVAAGADVNLSVPYDETPLINAARSGDVATVAFLVEHGADVNKGVMADGARWRTPYNQARNAGVREYLLQRGAIVSQR